MTVIGCWTNSYARGRFSAMSPEQFVSALDHWIGQGGPIPTAIPDDHSIATKDEANALCRALDEGDLYATDSIKTPALHRLIGLIQECSGEEAGQVLRLEAPPRLRKILETALESVASGDSGKGTVAQLRDT